MFKVKKLVLLLCVIVLLSTTGCWDYTELDKITLVKGFGIDINENNEIILTFQMLKPQNSTSQGETSEDKKVFIIEESGKTVFDAIRNASLHASRKLYFAHNQVIILGKKAAQSNPKGLLENFRRDTESRTLDYILIAENTASEILHGKGGLDSIQSQDLGGLVSNFKPSGKVVPIRLSDITLAMLSKTTSPIAPIVKLDEAGHSYLSDTAIIKNNRYVGNLNSEETRGYLWITNKLKSGIINIEDKEKDILIAFEIIDTNSKLKFNFKEDIVVEISLEAHTNLGNNLKSTKNVTEKELIHMQEEHIKKTAMKALNKANYYNADIFGFGEYIHANYPKQWKKIEKNWSHTFSQLKYEIDVKVEIKSHGRITTKYKGE